MGFPPDVDAFRVEVRSELSAVMDEIRAAGASDPTDLSGLPEATERRLLRWAGDNGWLALSLPTAYGGGGRPPIWQAAFNLEAARLDAPLVDTAVTLAGQPVLDFGTEAQKRRFLPEIARGELIFCIAYTEERAGSDLGALTTTARPEHDGFVLTGTKVHVTGAHKADWCVTVARTRADVAARKGLSMFLVPMDAPGVSVIRRPTMNGWTLDEVRFEELRLGPDALLGELDGGWSQLLAAVGTEGGGMFHVGFAQRAVEALTGELDDPETGGRLHVELAAAERLALRAVQDPSDVAAAMSKVYATELLQRIASTGAARTTEIRPLFEGAGWGWEFVERVHGTIGGGTNEMKRNLIARHLPSWREALPDGPTGEATQMALAAWSSGATAAPGSVQQLALAAAIARAVGTSRPVQATVCLGDHSSVTPTASPTLTTDLDAGSIHGTARLVPGADGAELLLVVAGTPAGPLVARVEPGAARIRPVPTLGDDNRADVTFDGGAGEILAPPGSIDLRRVVDVGRVAVAAEMAGAASAAFHSAVERAASRTQFGQAIIGFQAVAHRLADAAIDLATVTGAVFDAAGALDRTDPEAGVRIAGAKALANEACARITATAHQVWGAEGIYADHPLHRWHRRVRALAADLGRTAPLLRHVGAAASRS